MYCEHTAGHRSANFGTRMHFAKVYPPADFHQIVNDLYLHFEGQRFGLSTLGSSYVIISQTVPDRTNIAIANTQKVAYGLSIGILVFIFDMGPF